MLRFNVDWTVSGTSTVDVDEQELVEAGINPDDFSSDKELFLALDRFYFHDFSNDAVADYDERQKPEINMVYLYEEEF